jgi:2,4-dienoyl-CoA reductase-like NADH-dependent reductase (Old Yellow Enzyme family)
MKLFEQTRVNGMELKNRFIRSAFWFKGAEDTGHLNDFMCDAYEELARGGAGLIITGYSTVAADEKPNIRMLGAHDDSFIPDYRKLTDRAHTHGAKMALQICLGGSQSHHPDAVDMNLIGPSAVRNRVTGLTPKEAAKADIDRIIGQFADAAARAKAAGFDAVQIHAAHGYFLSSFLTPYYNRRTDEYNGGIHDRARIIYETVAAVRERVGPDFPVMIKMNYDDFMDADEGLVFADALEVFKRLPEAGVDLIEVSATNESSGKGLMPARTKIHAPEKQSYFLEATANIAAAVDIPVILMGGNRSTDRMQTILNETDIAYFSLARPLHSEPDLIHKWEADAAYKPRCVSCNRCWLSEPNRCVLNAS